MNQLNELIEKIAPIYNLYKVNSKMPGTQSLQLMWDIGDLLKQHIHENDVAPHNLYRQIYGKSEGKNNITQKSYITREFLGRCYRIRNIFQTKDAIITLIPSLREFTSFREAMPFFDNPIYKLNEEGLTKLLQLLNSNKKGALIVKELDVWKKSINNISNTRFQKLDKLDKEKKEFIDFYNFIYTLCNDNEYAEAINLLGIDDKQLIVLISKNLTALAQEGISIYEMPDAELQSETTARFFNVLSTLLKSKDEKDRRRFRRLIPPERIVRLSILVNSFASEQQFNKNKKGTR